MNPDHHQHRIHSSLYLYCVETLSAMGYGLIPRLLVDVLMSNLFIEVINFTEGHAFKDTISRGKGDDDENTKIHLANTEFHYRVARIDKLLYMYLSRDEVDEVDEAILRQGIEQLQISPL